MSLLQTQALSRLVIQASDITRSMEFYQRVFGYRVIMDLCDQPANRVIGVIGGLVMQILKARDPAPDEPAPILTGPPGYATRASSRPRCAPRAICPRLTRPRRRSPRPGA